MSKAYPQIIHKMPICCKNHLRCLFVVKKKLRIIARPDLTKKLGSQATLQVKIAGYQDKIENGIRQLSHGQDLEWDKAVIPGHN